ncbi:MAG: hypothetical protein IPH22_16410 [Nitrosomonas sp.]|nr:hypothetical protein [Nitrosomonas sp.]
MDGRNLIRLHAASVLAVYPGRKRKTASTTLLSCGACQLGRVRLENGQHDCLDGGDRAPFNIILLRVRLYQTEALQKAYAEVKPATTNTSLLTQKLLNALDPSHQQNPVYFTNGINLWAETLTLTTKPTRFRSSKCCTTIKKFRAAKQEARSRRFSAHSQS